MYRVDIPNDADGKVGTDQNNKDGAKLFGDTNDDMIGTPDFMHKDII